MQKFLLLISLTFDFIDLKDKLVREQRALKTGGGSIAKYYIKFVT